MGGELDRHGLIGIFAAEAEDGLQKIWKALNLKKGATPTPESLHELFIVGHSVRGAAALYGFSNVADLGEILESALEQAGGASSGGEWPAVVAMLRDLVETLRKQVDVIVKTDAEEPDCFAAWTARYPGVTAAQPFPSAQAQLEGVQLVDESSSTAALPSVDDVVPESVVHPPPVSSQSAAEEPASTDILTDSYLLPELDAEVLEFFGPEAQEYIETIETSLLKLEKEPTDAETIHKLFRAAHTLKGSAFTVGFQCIGDLTHHVEDFMGAVREGKQRVTSEATDIIFKAIDVVKALMKREAGLLEQIRGDYAAAQRRLAQLEHVTSSAAETPSAVAPSSVQPASMAAAPTGQEAPEKRAAPRAQEAAGAESKTAAEQAVIRVSKERLERLLNLVGELVISRGRLEQRLVALEQFANQVQSTKGRMVEAVRSFEEKHTFNVPASSASAAGGASGASLPVTSDFGGLEFDRYDDFNILARRMAEVSTDVGEVMAQLSGSIKKAREDMGLLQRLTLDMRDEIARARIVPIGTPFTRFKRAVREMARATGKDVELVTSGEQTEVDTAVVERLVDPLVHMVRNSVFHGIEKTEVRVACGKPAKGTVYLHAAHRGNSVVIEVEDDGGGLDVEKIKAKAVSVGLIRPEQTPDLPYADALKLIFLPGFTTADQIGDQAGRGVGMDVVKRVIESMNGQIDIETEKGVGTKFTLSLPFTLLISTALLVRVGAERYAIPLSSIREVVLAAPGAMQDVGGRPILQIGEEALEVRSLGRLIGLGDTKVEGARPVLVARGATGVTGLAVDELLGRQEIVVKTLGTLRPFQQSCFGGASIDPEGHVVLVLDIGRLLAGRTAELSGPALAQPLLAADGSEAEEAGAEATSGPTRILLIDDSLSVRKFVGRMLERAGYQVETAVDGEDGVKKATARRYSVIITDLEMPKLNGYEVLQTLRQRSNTKSTPIMVMTTRAGEKHQQAAMSLGASGYLTKPVEERALVAAVEQWVGRTTGATP
ncbi:MAG: response regulator [Nitrospirae bacterium]|nr:response regulator [Nitrospirota bacterium]